MSLDAMPLDTVPASPELEASLAKLARVIAGRDTVTLAFGTDGPRVEGEQLILPQRLSPGATDADAATDVLTGYVDLLAARIRHSQPAALAALRADIVKDLARSIEDRRVGELLFAAYPGARRFVLKSREYAAQRIQARWPELAWRDKFLWLLERTLWQETPSAVELEQALAAALRAAAPAIAKARLARSTRDSIQASHMIVAAVRALAAGSANNMMLSASPVDSLDAPAPATDFDLLDDDATDSVDATAPAVDADLPRSPERAPTASDEAAGMMSPSTAGGAPLATRAGTPAQEVRAGTAGKRPVLSVPLSTAFDVVTDFTGHGDAAAWRSLRAQARADTAPLRDKLERALRVDELTHWRREQERGEIDCPALARLAISPGYRTPFRVKRITKGRDAAVTLLLDCSGSMAGEKIELARLCAAALGDALMQLAFDCEVLGYSSVESADMKRLYASKLAAGADLRGYNRRIERLDLRVYKHFGTTSLAGLSAIACGHENPDGEALAWAAARLAEQRAERRILMILSDGYPATGDGDPAVLRSDLRCRIEALRKTGIELLGVGILSDAVESFYPYTIVVRKLNDLPSEAFAALGKMLLDR